MKKRFIVLGALILVFGFTLSTSWARPYVSGNLGVVFLNDSDLEDNYGDRAELSFDAGVGLTGAIGGSNENGLRAEVEFGYRANEMDEISAPWAGTHEIGGDMSAFSVMGNVFFDLMPNEVVSPFIGGGVGFANVEADLDYYGSDNDNVFAYQAGAGVAFAVTDYLKVDVQYRYFGTENPDFVGIEAEYDTHNLMIGIRQSF